MMKNLNNQSSTLGARLKQQRQKLGKTQEAFAEIGGVKRASQYNYEQDKQHPDVGYLQQVGKAGVDIQFVLTGVALGAEHLTEAAQTMRLKVLGALLGDELHLVKKTLPYEIFYACIEDLWRRFGAVADLDTAAIRLRIRAELGLDGEPSKGH